VSAPPGPTLRFRYGRTMGAGRMVKSVAGGLAIAVAAAVVVAASVVGSPTTAGATPPGYPDFAPDEFVALLDRASLPGTTPPGGPPGITGDGPADARIVALAEGTHYRLRRLSASPHSSAAGVPLNTEAAAALVQMAAAASGAGAPFVAVSGHRSVDDQRGIFLRELAARGRARIGRAYSNQEIASGAADAAINDVLRLNSIPGYSFHHTGNAVDLVAPGGSLGGFASSAAYRWLSGANYANAKVFGFVPSYPVGASAIGPDPEPWEFTYVGVRELRCAADLVALWNPGVGRCPVGNLDGLAVSGTRVTIGGWAADPDAGTRPIDVHVQVDGAILAVRADRDRPDVGAATPFGSRHGFEATVWLAPGRHTVCASAINDVPGEQATAIGCRVVDVRTRLPRGSLDRVASAGTRVRVDGWAADPDQPGAVLDVHPTWPASSSRSAPECLAPMWRRRPASDRPTASPPSSPCHGDCTGCAPSPSRPRWGRATPCSGAAPSTPGADRRRATSTSFDRSPTGGSRSSDGPPIPTPRPARSRSTWSSTDRSSSCGPTRIDPTSARPRRSAASTGTRPRSASPPGSTWCAPTPSASRGNRTRRSVVAPSPADRPRPVDVAHGNREQHQPVATR
jgi:LAS superfamily LD-carboxypeptidase LdcB